MAISDTDTALSGLDALGIGLRDETASGLRVASLKAELVYPVGVLPQGARDFVTETKQHLNYQPDYTGTTVITAAGAAFGNSVVVEPFPGWREGGNLNAVIVGDPGAAKTQPINAGLEPIASADMDSLNRFEMDNKQYKADLAAYNKSNGEGSEPQKPHFKSTIARDFTPEGLAVKHKYNDRSIIIHNDELIGFFKNFGRFHAGSEQQFYLEAFNRHPILIERKIADPLSIKHPHISLIGTIQPAILSELASGNRDKDGFMFRMIFAYPDNTKKQYWSTTKCSPETFSNWKAIIQRLLDIELLRDDHGNPAPRVLRFAPPAFDILAAWQRENADTCNAAESEMLKGFISKFDFFAVRFSLILEMLKYACDPTAGLPSFISAESVQGAIKLCDYYLSTAKKVCAALTELTPVEKLTSGQRKLYDALPECFTTKDGWKICDGLGLMSEPTYKRFIGKQELFEHKEHGSYGKRC